MRAPGQPFEEFQKLAFYVVSVPDEKAALLLTLTLRANSLTERINLDRRGDHQFCGTFFRGPVRL